MPPTLAACYIHRAISKIFLDLFFFKKKIVHTAAEHLLKK